ncbi:nucleotidyltransferase family protein [Coraliomargarita parva]|uniref:nucleotidyltransferase family protein n=1 Tax=Coraliomargarita parva TaxID=3014050 RepID=UPI0022B45C39|nr:nucleotidyltransferase family protein [Coraliomargarita parva]
MITIEAIRARLADNAEVLAGYHVAGLYLFGSAARQETEVHDLDFLVEFSEPPGLVNFMELKFFLEESFGLPVDLHTKNSCPQRFYDRIREDLKHVA